tara:strand:- start:986 stop:1357 length:372 start_codon:yes stop_codon:yes gene_type:complete
MATTNTYTNAKAILRGNTTVYTAPSAGVSIIKSIRVSNNDEENDREITLTLTDSDSVVYYLEINRTIQKKSSQEILAAGNMQTDSADSSVSSSTPIILKSSEILKATTTGSDIHIIVSALEMT